MSKIEVMERVLKDINNLDIKSVVSQYLPVKKIGSGYSAVCPFHNDKKIGNFHLDTKRNVYKCFCCGAYGDIIDFVSHMEGLSFSKTLVSLGERFGFISIDEMEMYFSESKAIKNKIKKTYIPKQRKETEELVPKATNAVLNFVYRGLLSSLGINKGHMQYLNDKRQLKKNEVLKTGYRSLGKNVNRSRVVNDVIQYLDSAGYNEDTLIGIPGFYKENGIWKMDMTEGLAIPIKNEYEEVVAIQIRKDNVPHGTIRYVWFSSSFATSKERKQKYACSPGQPVDVTFPVISEPNNNNKKKKKRQLIITEGKFKAELLSKKWGFIVISVQGVTNWKGIEGTISNIESILGYKFNAIYTAFDADLSTNYQVFEQLRKMSDSIIEELPSREIIYLHWDGRLGKGIDDLIINQPKLKSKKLIKKYNKNNIDKRYQEEVNKILEYKGETQKKIHEAKQTAIIQAFL